MLGLVSWLGLRLGVELGLLLWLLLLFFRVRVGVGVLGCEDVRVRLMMLGC